MLERRLPNGDALSEFPVIVHLLILISERKTVAIRKVDLVTEDGALDEGANGSKAMVAGKTVLRPTEEVIERQEDRFQCGDFELGANARHASNKDSVPFRGRNNGWSTFGPTKLLRESLDRANVASDCREGPLRDAVAFDYCKIFSCQCAILRTSPPGSVGALTASWPVLCSEESNGDRTFVNCA